MNDDTDGAQRPGGQRNSRQRLARAGPAVLAGTALAGTMLLVAGCGGGSPAAAPSAQPGQITAQTMDVFAACMRRHGLPGFYFSRTGNSAADGLTSVIQFGQWVAPADPGSPAFQPALKACQHLLPLRPVTPAQVQKQLNRDVEAAACMRAHGYPDYPDPSTQDGHVFRPPLPAGIDTGSPRFQAAQQACSKD